jgi:hypothetical protein
MDIPMAIKMQVPNTTTYGGAVDDPAAAGWLSAFKWRRDVADGGKDRAGTVDLQEGRRSIFEYLLVDTAGVGSGGFGLLKSSVSTIQRTRFDLQS